MGGCDSTEKTPQTEAARSNRRKVKCRARSRGVARAYLRRLERDRPGRVGAGTCGPRPLCLVTELLELGVRAGFDHRRAASGARCPPWRPGCQDQAPVPRRSGRPGRGSSTQSRCPQPRYRRHPPAPTRPRAAAARPSPRARLGARNAAGRKSSRRDITVVRRARADATKVSSEMSRPPTSPGGAGTRSSERSVSSRRWVARPGVVCDEELRIRIVSELLFPNFSWRLQTNRAQIVWANGHEAGKTWKSRTNSRSSRKPRRSGQFTALRRRARLPARCKTAGARAVWRVRRGHSAARTHRWRWGACESTRWAAAPGCWRPR